MANSVAAKHVLQLLSKTNRPYAINDIIAKCEHDLGKTAVQKALDQLVANDSITLKSFGKTKIYFIKQRSNLAELKVELLQAQQRLKQAQHNFKNKQVQYRDMAVKLEKLQQKRSMESVEAERDKLLDDIRQMNEKLRRLKAAAAEAKLSVKDVQQIEQRYVQVTGAYRKRKRICGDMLDAILEGYPKSKKALIEDIGVETDEEIGFKLETK